MTSTLIKNIAVAGIACVVLTMGVGPLSASDLDAQAQAISKAAATDYAIHLKALFEHLHANPELSFQEKNTSAKIADELRSNRCAKCQPSGFFKQLGTPGSRSGISGRVCQFNVARVSEPTLFECR